MDSASTTLNHLLASPPQSANQVLYLREAATMCELSLPFDSLSFLSLSILLAFILSEVKTSLRNQEKQYKFSEKCKQENTTKFFKELTDTTGYL